MRAIVGAALASLCFCPAVARAKWFESSSDHFVIYADDSQRDIQGFSERLERYHSALALISGRDTTIPSPSNRVNVFVVHDIAQVQKLAGDKDKIVGGFYWSQMGRSYAVVPAISDHVSPAQCTGSLICKDLTSLYTNTLITLLHEYAHHFIISTNSQSLPRWLNEGSAEFFSSSSFEPDGSMRVGRPANHRVAELQWARDVKASELLDPEEYKKRKTSQYDTFYGKSWLLYHYLTFAPSRKGQLLNYLNLLGKGVSQRQAALEAFGDFTTLEKDIERYLDNRMMTVMQIPADRLTVGAIHVRPLSAGEAAIMPLLIRSTVGVDEQSAKSVAAEARTIAAKFPGDAAVLSEVAEAEFDAGNDSAAITAADAALAIDPAQVNAYVQKGYALFDIAGKSADKAAAFKAARMPFVALNRREHDHPIPLLYFYRSYVDQGLAPTELAMAGLQRAALLAPFDFSLRITLATAEIRLGHMAEAREALTPVAYDPHGGELSGAARRVLARLNAEPGWRGADIDKMIAEKENPDAPKSPGQITVPPAATGTGR